MQKKDSFKLFITGFVSVIILLLGPSLAFSWHGKIVDKMTGSPIREAVVVRSWYRVSSTPAGSVTSFKACKEVLSDDNGDFWISPKIFTIFVPILSKVVEKKPIVFKAGYELMVLDSKKNIIELSAVPTFIETRKREVEKVRGNYEIDYYHTAILQQLIGKEEEFIESEKLPVRTITKKIRVRSADIRGPSSLGISKKPSMISSSSVHSNVGGLIKTKGRQKRNEFWTAAKAKDIKKVPELIIGLRDEDVGIRLAAAYALGEIQDPRSIEPLIRALADESFPVRKKAQLALIKLGKQAVDSLINALKSENRHIQKGSTLALGEIRNPKAIEPLISVLKLRKHGVSWTAAVALGNYRNKKVIKALVKSLEYDDGYFRATLRGVLIGIGPQAVNPLIDILNSEDPSVRQEAVKILGGIKDVRATFPLIDRLKDENYRVREETAIALSKIRDSRSVEPLLVALNDEYRAVRAQSANALVAIGDPAVSALLVQLKNKKSYIRWRAAWCLGRIKNSTAVEGLLANLTDKVAEVRWSTIEALGEIGDVRAYEKLFKMCNDEDLGIREKAISSLAKIAGENAGVAH